MRRELGSGGVETEKYYRFEARNNTEVAGQSLDNQMMIVDQ